MAGNLRLLLRLAVSQCLTVSGGASSTIVRATGRVACLPGGTSLAPPHRPSGRRAAAKRTSLSRSAPSAFQRRTTFFLPCRLIGSCRLRPASLQSERIASSGTRSSFIVTRIEPLCRGCRTRAASRLAIVDRTFFASSEYVLRSDSRASRVPSSAGVSLVCVSVVVVLLG